MSKIKFFDATLRDGNHAIKHQLSVENVEDYCQAIDRVGMYTVIVGHGNGLGASSLQVGLAKTCDADMIKTARENLQKTKLGAYLIPGFGTIKDNIIPAIEGGVDLFKIGCHCTEADTTRQHIEYIRNAGKEVYGVLMMYHMASTERLLEEVHKMENYGAKGVILMDSAGASTPELVKRTFCTLYDKTNIQLGFHAHNNLGLAVGNTYIALNEGAEIIDGTVRGFGAGAGNCQLEAIAALLQKEEKISDIDLYAMMDASEKVVKTFSSESQGLDDISIINGIAGTFSAFKVHVMRAAKQFNVDPRDILMELGRRKTVAGQEDLIVEIAAELQNQDDTSDEAYFLSSLL